MVSPWFGTASLSPGFGPSCPGSGLRPVLGHGASIGHRTCLVHITKVMNPAGGHTQSFDPTENQLGTLLASIRRAMGYDFPAARPGAVETSLPELPAARAAGWLTAYKTGVCFRGENPAFSIPRRAS